MAVAALRHAAARLAAVARAVTKAAGTHRPTAASGAQRGARRPAWPPEVRARAPTTDPHPNAFDRPPIAPHQPPNDSAAPSRRPTTCAHVAPAGRHIGADRPFHAAAHARRVAPSFDRSYVASALPRCRIPRGRYVSTVTFSVGYFPGVQSATEPTHTEDESIEWTRAASERFSIAWASWISVAPHGPSHTTELGGGAALEHRAHLPPCALRARQCAPLAVVLRASRRRHQSTRLCGHEASAPCRRQRAPRARGGDRQVVMARARRSTHRMHGVDVSTEKRGLMRSTSLRVGSGRVGSGRVARRQLKETTESFFFALRAISATARREPREACGW